MGSSFRRRWRQLVSRMDRIADQEADPTALSGRSSSRRRPRGTSAPPAESTGVTVDVGTPDGPPGRAAPVQEAETVANGDLPEERVAHEAQLTLDRLRADQHRRMRGRWGGAGRTGGPK